MSAAAGPAEKAATTQPAERIRLTLAYIDFWSVVKIAFLLGLAGAVILIVTVPVAYAVFASTDAFAHAGALLQQLAGPKAEGLQLIPSLPQVMGFTVIVGVLNTIVSTALGAIAALLYNLAGTMVGGMRVGFSRR
ncbi:DUF3566 domain-containing protein [Rathayibacter iranicus]|uniref:DUF3566 domain-containing protein n=2 Tax=Rathayibacter iranicus TaxID=59737 RepID=A0AAD1EMV3_9MICO|nr:DUF3566 domain-containing protein [Rathayibacter iranicus]AZZ56518.1 DUF3566 domain-containing protein [Rathayibacter iranicus]MWV31940.1 DUF3566 domain-containing protein [Rathayibacter iranicus NCPPB 2253 = VKM Ac-1602]PPI43749.1 hypothetical protein C5E09_10920 [Rathayibacter iranicus]PPI58904.1 hypothetical protein C5E08_11835 [Rathayibacter iranicus]PPI69857.1 hypothetical protein C5E01_10885 [Rathayibacter iranicus]